MLNRELTTSVLIGASAVLHAAALGDIQSNDVTGA